MGIFNPAVTKTIAVLKRSEFGYTAYANFIPFEMEIDGMVSRTLVMARKDVDALGWPEEITVTVEPGNTIDAQQKDTVPGKKS